MVGGAGPYRGPRASRPGPYAGCLDLVPPYETLWESQYAPHRIDDLLNGLLNRVTDLR